MNEKWFKNIWFVIILLVMFGPALGKNGFVVLIAAVFLVWLFKFAKNKKIITNNPTKSKPKMVDLRGLKIMDKVKKSILAAVAVFFGLWLFFASIYIVDAGETGVYSLFGKVSDQELRSGFHLVIPLAKVTLLSIRTEEYTMSIAQGEGKKYAADAISSLTKEGLAVDLDITVLYHLNEDQASDVYKNVGTDFEEKLVRPTIRTAIRDIIAQYEAKDIYSEKREEASQKIFEKLKGELDSRGLIVEEVLLRNVNLPAGLTQSIQEKLQAEQEAEKYDFLLDRERKEKERKIIEAEGQRDAQNIISQSLTTNYLYYLYINELKEREGTIYVPTGTTTGVPLFRDLGR